MKVTLKQINGLSLAGKGGTNHWITMDGEQQFGGSDAAPRPMELILMGLGGCTSMDVISILRKMREPLDDFEVDMNAERAEEHPKVFKMIHISYKFFGKGLNKDNIEKAITLSHEKYCPGTAMLRKAAEITFDYTIQESKTNE